ncbi:hypothetical protein [Clostridium manihotivorum]|uniref:TATA-box binding n=1 Tax=Clostridium manihotivorum TaxID=2320868 RepID=A0A410DQX6_9CLOT|nr:hypothetical protein [Clostridium manihotivorum]QAA31441.1 hypothetical protein C1I91_07170 [Clostridium manihotivorum]
MRIKYALLSVILLTFSFDILGHASDSNYNLVTNEILKENSASIVECGIKIQYQSKKNIDEIYRRTIEKIYKDAIIEYKEYKPSYFRITYKKDGVANEIVANVENNITNICATSTMEINKDTTNILKQQLEKVLYDASIDVQYFSYVKGNIIEGSAKNNIELTERALVKYGATDVNTIKLSSGFTGVAKLKDNTAINYAISENDKRTYLIIGTPIIFITY